MSEETKNFDKAVKDIETEITRIDKVIKTKPTCKSRWINGYLDGLKTAMKFLRKKGGLDDEA